MLEFLKSFWVITGILLCHTIQVYFDLCFNLCLDSFSFWMFMQQDSFIALNFIQFLFFFTNILFSILWMLRLHCTFFFYKPCNTCLDSSVFWMLIWRYFSCIAFNFTSICLFCKHNDLKHYIVTIANHIFFSNVILARISYAIGCLLRYFYFIAVKSTSICFVILDLVA